MLACTAGGGELPTPTFIIFKRKTLPKGVKWPNGVIVRCTVSGQWLDDMLMVDWVKNIWGKCPSGLSKKSLLVLDAFRCHKSERMKEMLKEQYKTTLTIIPGRMTSILQPLEWLLTS